MPPRVRITKESIVETALGMVRESGAGAINARSVASALGCSTQPVFSNFATMEELERAVILAAYEHYLEFLKKELEGGKYPPYKSYGMAYIRFAEEEKELFKLLFMCDKNEADFVPKVDFDASVEMIMSANSVGRSVAEFMHLEMWAVVHGIATMRATSFLKLDWEVVSKMLSDVYQGIRAVRLSEGDDGSDKN